MTGRQVAEAVRELPVLHPPRPPARVDCLRVLDRR